MPQNWNFMANMQKLTKLTLTLAAGLSALAAPAAAQPAPAPNAPTYADLVDLADPADLVIRAQIRDQALLRPERARGVRPGYGRLYVEARTLALIAGSEPIGESIRYLVDVPLD